MDNGGGGLGLFLMSEMTLHARLSEECAPEPPEPWVFLWRVEWTQVLRSQTEKTKGVAWGNCSFLWREKVEGPLGRQPGAGCVSLASR